MPDSAINPLASAFSPLLLCLWALQYLSRVLFCCALQLYYLVICVQSCDPSGCLLETSGTAAMVDRVH